MRDDFSKIFFWCLTLGVLVILVGMSQEARAEEEDLFLDFFDITARYPITEEEVSMNVTAFTDTNITANVTVTVYDLLEGEAFEVIIHNQTLPYADLGGVNLKFDHIWPSDRAGKHFIRLEIDPENNHTEANESNNNLTVEIIVSAEPTPELTFRVIDPLFTNPESPLTNISAQLIFNLVNEGHASAGQFGVRFSESYEGGGYSQVEFRFYSELEMGDTLIGAFNWTPDRIGTYSLRIEIDSDDDVDEIDEDNNIMDISAVAREHLAELSWVADIQIHLASTDDWLSEPYANHTLALRGVLENQDVERDARAVEVDIWDTPDGALDQNYVGRVNLVQVLAQTSETVEPSSVEIEWLPANGSSLPGLHHISMVIDPRGLIPEYDRSNNFLNGTVFILTPKPDVLPLGIFVNNETEEQPSELSYSNINISIANQGAKNVANLRVDLQYSGSPIETFYVALNEGTDENFTFQVFWPLGSIGFKNLRVILDDQSQIAELDEDNNIKEVFVYVGLRKVDFAITQVLHEPDYFDGQTISTQVSLYNLASRIFSGVEVKIFVDEVLIKEDVINTLDSLENRTKTYSWTLDLTEGKHNLTVEALNKNQSVISDQNLSNNFFSSNFTVKPNLYQLYIFPFEYADKLILNETADLSFIVINLGEHAVDKVNVAVRIDDKLLEVVEVGPVPSNSGETPFSVKWNPQTTGEHKITVIADPDNLIDEYDEDDNSRSGTVMVKKETAEVITPTESKGFLEDSSLVFALLALLAVLAIAAVFTLKLRNQGELIRPGMKPQAGAPIGTAAVKVTSESAICLECLRPVEDTSAAVNCACGKVYHPKCTSRVQRCHACGESLE